MAQPSTGEILAYSGVGVAALVGLMWFHRGPHPNFTWAELSTTSTGLPNDLPLQAKMDLHRLVWTVLAPLREVFGPLRINSGFRSLEVNTAVGGSTTSAHLHDEPGETAVDVEPADPARGTNWDIVHWLWNNGQNMNLDQVIGYHDRSHVHIGLGPRNRNQFLAHNAGNYTSWSPSNA